MTRKTAQSDYDSVFEPSRSSSRAKSVQTEPAASPDDVADLVEQQVRQITNAVRLMAAPLVPVIERETADEWIQGGQCQRCEETDEPHIHGAKLFAAGKEIF